MRTLLCIVHSLHTAKAKLEVESEKAKSGRVSGKSSSIQKAEMCI